MMENNEEKFEIRDLRQKDQYITDDKFLNGYARFLGIYALGVYGSLCRHANQKQRSWPSVKRICDELSIGRCSVLAAIKRLEYWRIIKKFRIGKSANNRYDLIKKTYWIPVSEQSLKTYSEVCHIDFTSLLSKLQRYVIQTSNSKELNNKEIKERDTSPKKLKPYFRGMQIVEQNGKKFCIPKDGSQWLEFAGKKEDIKWE